jgi:hypothetical protein
MGQSKIKLDTKIRGDFAYGIKELVNGMTFGVEMGEE